MLEHVSTCVSAPAGLESTTGSVAVKGTGLEFVDLTYTVIAKQKKEGQWVTREVNLLNNITGQAPRGQVTAVMGPSGAGKSTLLDALAGRIASGSLEGDITVDSHPVNPSLMKRISAYVMQVDLYPLLCTNIHRLVSPCAIRSETRACTKSRQKFRRAVSFFSKAILFLLSVPQDDQLFPMLTVYETFLFAAEVRLPSSVSRSEKKVRVEELIDQLGLTVSTRLRHFSSGKWLWEFCRFKLSHA